MAEKKLKILLVDDDTELRQMYAEIFRNAHFDVLEAGDGLEGLDMATKEIPDVIFTGIVMPRMDGFAMMENLNKMVITSNIPVVISSHMGREEDQQRASMLGAKDFIIRNATPPIEVVERISSLFLEGGEEYNISFDPYALDAQRLAKELNFQASFQCLNCNNEKLVVHLKLVNPTDRLFEAKLICPNCGWIAK